MKLVINANITIHVHPSNDEVVPLLTEVLARLEDLQRRGTLMMAEIDTLEALVEENTTVVGSAELLIEQIVAMLEAAKTDPIRLQAVIDKLSSSKTSLAEAVAANTPPPAPVTP